MLDPEYLRQITDAAEAIASEIHDAVMVKMVQRMVKRWGDTGEFKVSQQEAWQLKTIMESGYLKADIQKEIAKKTGALLKTVKGAFKDALVESVKWSAKVFEAAGIAAEELGMSPFVIRLAQRALNATNNTLTNMTRTTADAAQQTFIRECDKAYNLAASGAVGETQAIADAIEQVSQTASTVTYTKNGKTHTDSVETAVTRAVRTGIGQMSGDIEKQRMDEFDWDIILVSAHLGARYGDGGENASNHFWWQGKFYSKSGKDKRFPPFSVTGYGTGEGLSGWNCRHSFGAGDGVFNPYEKYDSDENKRIYDLTQKQRARERRVRALKHDVLALKTAISATSDPELKDELQRRYHSRCVALYNANNAYMEFCGKNNLRPLDDRLAAAGFTGRDFSEVKKEALRAN